MELSFEVDVYPILQDNCSCHVGGSPAGLALPNATAAYDNLVDVASTQEPTLDRVTPGDPDNSYLYQKIAGTGGGGQMPLNMPPLSADEMMTISDWIAEGALP
ncbi:MAG: hypothetical protein HC927_03040 [Deltaproteobacteria bacterium]|nr:hypothetical protein [Deltaproteobacteria bacterium]